MPYTDNSATTHVAMLVERGVHLLENLNLEDLSHDGVKLGLFVALPLKIIGATGSWVRPILVV
jgi:kynurenine formamidase